MRASARTPVRSPQREQPRSPAAAAAAAAAVPRSPAARSPARSPRRARSPRCIATSPGRRVASLPQGPLQGGDWGQDAEANRARHIERRAAARTQRQEHDARVAAALTIQRFHTVSDDTARRRRAARSPARSPETPAAAPSPVVPRARTPEASAVRQLDSAFGATSPAEPQQEAASGASAAVAPQPPAACCPAGHSLAPFMTPAEDYRCARCGAVSRIEQSMWSCTAREYTVCSSCYAAVDDRSSSGTGAKEAARLGEATGAAASRLDRSAAEWLASQGEPSLVDVVLGEFGDLTVHDLSVVITERDDWSMFIADGHRCDELWSALQEELAVSSTPASKPAVSEPEPEPEPELELQAGARIRGHGSSARAGGGGGGAGGCCGARPRKEPQTASAVTRRVSPPEPEPEPEPELNLEEEPGLNSTVEPPNGDTGTTSQVRSPRTPPLPSPGPTPGGSGRGAAVTAAVASARSPEQTKAMASKRLAVQIEAELAEEKEAELRSVAAAAAAAAPTAPGVTEEGHVTGGGSGWGASAVEIDASTYKLVQLYAAAQHEHVRNAMIAAKRSTGASSGSGGSGSQDQDAPYASFLEECLPKDYEVEFVTKGGRFERWHSLWVECDDPAAEPTHCYTDITNHFMVDVRSACRKLDKWAQSAAVTTMGRADASHSGAARCACVGPHWPSCPLNPQPQASLIQGHWRGYAARKRREGSSPKKSSRGQQLWSMAQLHPTDSTSATGGGGGGGGDGGGGGVKAGEEGNAVNAQGGEVAHQPPSIDRSDDNNAFNHNAIGGRPSQPPLANALAVEPARSATNARSPSTSSSSGGGGARRAVSPPPRQTQQQRMEQQMFSVRSVQRAWRGYRTRRQIAEAIRLKAALSQLELPPGLSTPELEAWLNDGACSLPACIVSCLVAAKHAWPSRLLA